MLNLQTVEHQILKDFAETLRERSRADSSFIDEDTIDQIIWQMADNLSAKSDLFDMIRVEPEKTNEETLSFIEKFQTKKSEDIQQTNKQQVKSHEQEGQPEEKSENKQEIEQDNWEKQDQAERELTEKVDHLSKMAINAHISAIYDQKTSRYIATKDEHRLTLSPLIIKTEKAEFLIHKMLAIFSRGDKQQVFELAQQILSKNENREYSQDEKNLLLDEIVQN